jgi:hypothetical protein
MRSELEDLYQLRSDCVHGKLPFTPLQGAEPNTHMGQREFVAETIAREAILHVLRSEKRIAMFADRSSAEKAWTERALP